MPTVINNPPPQTRTDGDGGGIGSIIAGLIVAGVLLYLFFIFVLPAIRDEEDTEINIPNPTIQVQPTN